MKGTGLRVKRSLRISLWISQDWKCLTGICKQESETWRKGHGQRFSFGNHQDTEIVKILRVDDSPNRSSVMKKTVNQRWNSETPTFRKETKEEEFMKAITKE